MISREDIVQSLKDYFSQREDVKGVMLYGSIVEGNFTDASDIDVAVDFDRPMELDEQLDLIREIDTLTKGDVDLVDLHTTRGLIHYEIMTKGERLKGSNSIWVYNMKEALYFHADFLPQLNDMSKKRIESMLNG